MWPLATALLALCIASRRSGPRLRVALALLANWVANTGLAQITGNQFNWHAMALIDYATGLFILSGQLGRPQALIAAIYVGQIVAHAAFGMSDKGAWATWEYYWALLYLAWAQVIVMAVWIGHGRYRVAADPGRDGGSLLAGDARADSVAVRGRDQ